MWWRPELAGTDRMRKLTILVGTMTGTAELAAEAMSVVLQNEFGFSVELVMMDDARIDVFEGDCLYLICTSTFGKGDPPDTAIDFYQELENRRPDLRHVRFGVFGLGDSTYGDTFNGGGKRFEELLVGLGAEHLGSRAKHDCRSAVSAEEFGENWVREWAAVVLQQLGTGRSEGSVDQREMPSSV